MTNHGTVPQNQYNEFLAALITALPAMTPDQMQKFIRLAAKTKRKKFRELFIGTTTDTEAWREEWTRFYMEVFSLAVDLSGVTLPAEAEELAWLVALAKELGDKPMNRAMDACRKLFKVNQYANDLDAAVPTNDRDLANGSYVIRIRARVEADEELKNLSANQIAELKLVTMTLLERIILELFYFWKTGGKHMDIQNITLCSGSRYSDGDVPRCRLLGDGDFYVLCYRPGYSNDDLRARVAVAA